MNEKLQDKVVAIELAGNNIFIANDNDNFKNELISIGFEKVEPYYSISMPIGDVEKRAVLFQKLIEIGTLFFRNFTLIFWLKSMMVMCMKWMIRVYVCIHTLI